MSGPRVGVVGARRRRHGLGPFVARDLAAAGAEMPCFLATSRATLDLARRALAEIAGVEARGYLDLEAMLEREHLDALAILSPAETHAGLLDATARAGLHALCEKPFVWAEPDLVGRTRALVGAFEERGLALWENCQWPYSLSAFEALHPGALDAPPRRFEMLLQPASTGVQSLGDSLPHPISLLQALFPGSPGAIENVWFSTRESTSPTLILRFRYRSGEHSVEVEISLRQHPTQPRRASLALDGRRAERLVSLADYRLSFADSGRSVPMRDPLTLLVADFVGALRAERESRPTSRGFEILQRMQLLAALVGAYEEGR